MTEIQCLNELVVIWEYWTEADPLLRRGVQAVEGTGALDDNLFEHMGGQLSALARCRMPGDMGRYAAVLAGWAVVLALSDTPALDRAFWRTIARDAQEAHQQALADRDASPEQRCVQPG